MITQKISIGFANNPELRGAFASAAIGGTAKAEVEFRVIAKDDNGLEGVLTSVIPDGFAADKDETSTAVGEVADTGSPSPGSALPPVA